MLPFLLPALLAQAPLTDGGAVVVKGQRFLAEVARTAADLARVAESLAGTVASYRI